MNKHKNTNKQGEKILLSGIAATTLGLISTKPQIVKADSQNGNRLSLIHISEPTRPLYIN